MAFLELLKHREQNNKDSHQIVGESVVYADEVFEKEEDAADILRRANLKIKLVTPTLFGSQISFAKQYKKLEIETLLKNFKLKFLSDDDFIKEVFIIK